MKTFFEELKNRRVYRVAIGYAVAGSAVVQVAGTVLPIFHVRDWVQQVFVVLIAFGFPLALVLAWCFELEGGTIKRTCGDSRAVASSRRVWILGGVGLLVSAFALAGYWFWHPWKTSPEVVGPGGLPTPEKSIAVLPFENLSDDKQNAFFTDGVQDEILANLAKIADLKVISRTSVMLYKSGNPRNVREIGQQLGAARVLEGSVQRAANRVRVNAQLIDARTDAHLWAQTYDRDLADVFAIQSEVAKTIADQLQAKLSPNEKAAIERPPTTDVSAFDLYSRAKTLTSSTSFTAASRQSLLQA